MTVWLNTLLYVRASRRAVKRQNPSLALLLGPVKTDLQSGCRLIQAATRFSFFLLFNTLQQYEALGSSHPDSENFLFSFCLFAFPFFTLGHHHTLATRSRHNAGKSLGHTKVQRLEAQFQRHIIMPSKPTLSQQRAKDYSLRPQSFCIHNTAT